MSSFWTICGNLIQNCLQHCLLNDTELLSSDFCSSFLSQLNWNKPELYVGMQVTGWVGGEHGQVFGAQWLLSVWQSRERRRTQWVCWNSCIRKLPLGEAKTSQTPTALFVKSHCYQTTCLGVTQRFLSMPRCPGCETVTAQSLTINSVSKVVLRCLLLLSTDDKLWYARKRKHIKLFHLPFVVSLISAIHVLLRHCLSRRCSVWRLCLFAFTNKQSLRRKNLFLEIKFKARQLSCCKETLLNVLKGQYQILYFCAWIKQRNMHYHLLTQTHIPCDLDSQKFWHTCWFKMNEYFN